MNDQTPNEDGEVELSRNMKIVLWLIIVVTLAGVAVVAYQILSPMIIGILQILQSVPSNPVNTVIACSNGLIFLAIWNSIASFFGGDTQVKTQQPIEKKKNEPNIARLVGDGELELLDEDQASMFVEYEEQQ